MPSTSNTKNVKLGVCKALFGGVDLGYTQGGVEVTVQTETHKTTIDQFGKTSINEFILGRSVNVKVPLAETTLDNLVAIMPGATLTGDGVQASGSVTIVTNPTNGQNLLINGKTFTFKTAASGPFEVGIAGSVAITASTLAGVLSASSDNAINCALYGVTGAQVLVTYAVRGVAGNAFTLASGTTGAAVTVSGATLSGGVDNNVARVDVATGIGIDLLTVAKELRLHPKNKPDNDKSDDFVIPLAATAGSLKFAYKLENERIYDCEFSGYPDPATNRLFYVGA